MQTNNRHCPGLNLQLQHSVYETLNVTNVNMIECYSLFSLEHKAAFKDFYCRVK